jgi:hypothetical protein
MASLQPAFAETLLETVQRLSDSLEKLKTQCGAQSNVSFSSGSVSFYGNAGKRVAAIGDTAEKFGGSSWFYSADGKLKAVTGVNSVGGGYTRYYNTAGSEVAYIGAVQSGKGTVEVNGADLADFSEVFELARRNDVLPGTVMAETEGGKIAPSEKPYDRRVVGVISGAGDLQPGMRIGSREDGSKDLPIALIGQVYVRVTGENGAIEIGDLLVSSRKIGVAMRGDPNRAVGTVIGKALQPYRASADNEGLIRMLVMNR